MTRRAMASAAVAAAVLLAGCTSGDAATGQASTTVGTTTVSPSTTPTTTPASATPTATSPPGLSGIPAAARARTAKGAETFVRHYFDQLNQSWTKPDPDLLVGLSGPNCKTCQNFIRTAQSYAANGRRQSKNPLDFQTVRALGFTGSQQQVSAQFRITGSSVLSPSGGVLRTEAPGMLRMFLTLEWRGAQWIMAKAQVIP